MRKTTTEEIEINAEAFAELCGAIATLGSGIMVERLLRELCTPTECVDMAKRWRLVGELIRGKTQRAVASALGLSLCKITRGARYVKAPDSTLASLARIHQGGRRRPNAHGRDSRKS